MQSTPRRVRRARRVAPLLAFAVVLAGTSTAPPTPVAADQHSRASAGIWSGQATAQGTALADLMGFDVTGWLRMTGDLDFAVGAAGGEVVGQWTFDAPALLNIVGSREGVDLDVIADVSFSGGGPMSGDAREIQLDGTFRTQGSILNQPIDNVGPMPTLTMRVVTATCNEVHGEWTFSIEGALENADWSSADIDGSWFAFRDDSESFTPDIEALGQAIDDAALVDTPASPDETIFSGSPLADEAADLIFEYNEFVQRLPDWPLDELFDLLDRVESMLADVRSIDDCDQEFLGDTEFFTSILTGVVQQLIINGLEQAMTVENWQTLAHTAARTGAIGSGSPYPELAARAETVLIEFAEVVLDTQLDPNGQIGDAPESRAVLATSAALGFDLEVGGVTSPASQLWHDDLIGTGSD